MMVADWEDNWQLATNKCDSALTMIPNVKGIGK